MHKVWKGRGEPGKTADFAHRQQKSQEDSRRVEKTPSSEESMCERRHAYYEYVLVRKI